VAVNQVFISGLGAVSPAGWTVGALRDALAKGHRLATQPLDRPGLNSPLKVMRVAPPHPQPSYLAHARLRRASPISRFALSAALEALGPENEAAAKTAVITCVFSGCVNYSRRFYEETLKEPATASPLLFPETVFNAPASHISAFLGSDAINYTLVGDVGTMLTGLALGARWLLEGRAEQCVIVGAEEIDWLTADALRLFDRSKTLSEGAGAVLLTRTPRASSARLSLVTDEFLHGASTKAGALQRMRQELGEAGGLLCDSTTNDGGISREEFLLWKNWTGPRVSLKKILGEGLMAAAAWQVVFAADAVATRMAPESIISLAGFHQHAVGARICGVP
jgi:3-oxoacyl-(acyl-carrier-protein) synthase